MTQTESAPPITDAAEPMTLSRDGEPIAPDDWRLNDAITPERAVAAAWAAMRRYAAKADNDDFADAWANVALDRRPVFLVAALLPAQTLTWLLEPGRDIVLTANVHHWLAADGQPVNVGPVDVVPESFLHHVLNDRIHWLVKDETGLFPPLMASEGD